MPYNTPYSESLPYALLKDICEAKKPKGYIANQTHIETNNSIILPVAKDNESPAAIGPIYQKTTPSIQKVFESLPLNSAPQKKILIPIAEGHKHLGLIQRKHFVTLMYDPQENRATLLDSRPWYVSFLYPTSKMKQSLKAGIERLYGKEIANSMRFETKYQGVQHNDIDCGAWTVRNIGDLAGVFGKEPTTIAQQVKRYRALDIGVNPDSNKGYGPDPDVTIALRYGTGIILANNLGLPYEPLPSPSLFKRFFSWFTKPTKDRNDDSLVKYSSLHVFYKCFTKEEKESREEHKYAGIKTRNQKGYEIEYFGSDEYRSNNPTPSYVAFSGLLGKDSLPQMRSQPSPVVVTSVPIGFVNLSKSPESEEKVTKITPEHPARIGP